MLKKSILFILMIMFVSIFLEPTIFAAGLDNVIADGDSFITAGSDDAINETKLGSTSKYIYNLLFSIAVVVSIVVGMVLGIKFMTSGSDEQAKIKETLIPYVVGVFVIFASFTIWKIVITIGNKVVGGS